MILISLLVHEKPEVVLDQIANFKKYAPEALIVIHPARQFVESSDILETLKGIEGVWLNPKPFYTGFGLVLKCHVSNFLFAREAGIPFTHFCLHASNDMLVRPGMEDYVRRHDFGFFQHDLSSDSVLFSFWIPDFQKDHAYRKIMRDIGALPTNLASQVEGTFYPNEAFDSFAHLVKRHAWCEFPWLPGYVQGSNLPLVNFLNKLGQTRERRKYMGKYAYPREEFYQANFFSTICRSPAAPYCFMNWEAELKVTAKDIGDIRDGIIPMGQYDALFAVKRINRDLNDPMRKLIGSLDAE
ncbi:MAG: hypothetical protein H7Y36_00685 [Armatimonadetes bacterium]|nr:hypothetical protein [Akkermansiaceae bacterium]